MCWRLGEKVGRLKQLIKLKILKGFFKNDLFDGYSNIKVATIF